MREADFEGHAVRAAIGEWSSRRADCSADRMNAHRNASLTDFCNDDAVAGIYSDSRRWRMARHTPRSFK